MATAGSCSFVVRTSARGFFACQLALFLALSACSGEPPLETISQKREPLLSGIVAAYGFDEGSGTTFADASGNALHGTLEGPTWVSGKYGAGLAFSDTWATVADSNLLDFPSDLTVSAWIKPAIEHTDWPTIVMKEGATGTLTFNYALSSDWMNLSGDLMGASGSLYSNGVYFGVYGAGQRPPGKWTHIASTYNGAEFRVFVNGSLAGTTPLDVDPMPTVGPLRIGANLLWNQFFHGVIDEVRVYGRALAPEEVQFDMYTAVSDTTPGPIALIAPEPETPVWGESVPTKVFVRDPAVARVQFLVDGALVGAEDTAAPFEGIWDSTTVTNGTHTVSAQAKDSAGTLLSTTSVDVTVKNGLIAAYGFDEGSGTTAADVTGNAQDGTLSDQTWVSGKFGSALEFNEGFVTVENSDLLNPGALLTVSAWVKPLAQQSNWPVLLMKESSAGEEFAYALLGERLEGAVTKPPSFAIFLGGNAIELSGGTTPVGTWTHLASTYDGTELRFYVNGDLVDSILVDLPPLTSGKPLRMGGNSIWDAGDGDFQGVIDEVRVYNQGLSQAEVQALMNSPVGGACTPVDDGNPCTLDDCDAIGTPTHVPVTDGTTCADGNACTQTDTCQAGVCVGANPVVCTALDACHDAGTCDPATGACSNPTKPDGALCVNATVCDGTETCQAGVCTSGTPLAVTDGNPCTEDSCDAILGVSHEPASSGTPCSEGSCQGGFETGPGTCDGLGACLPGPIEACGPYLCGPGSCLTSCSTSDDCDGVAVCEEGACLAGPNESCSDDLECSTGACVNGSCCAEDVEVYPFASLDFNPTISTDFATQAAPLYSGSSPTQFPVLTGAIDPERVSVLRGRVLTFDGSPLGCVAVSVVGAPDVGETKTRSDGSYAIAVNGNGRVVIRVAPDGYVPAFREVFPARHSFALVSDIRLTPHGPTAHVSADAVDITVVAGETETDATGTRRATLLIDPGTHALVEGEASPRSEYSVRVKEVTNLNRTRDAMPAMLPPASAFTYAVSLSLGGVEGQRVTFDKPIAVYVEDFIGFPNGEEVPVGYFDEETGTWVASENGRVIRIVNVNAAGEAELDINASSGIDDPSPLGIDSPERIRLASLYPIGTALWRFTVDHFSTWDANWGWGPDPGAQEPNQSDPDQGGVNPPCDSQKPGSIIACESQSLGERLPITAT